MQINPYLHTIATRILRSRTPLFGRSTPVIHDLRTRLLVLLIVLLGCSAAEAGAGKGGAPMLFAARMAEEGNWHEANYRWTLLSRKQPDNFKLFNNLAVSMEVLGKPERAAEHYREALRLAPDNPEIKSNFRRFNFFWEENNPGATSETAPPTSSTTPAKPKQQKKQKTFKALVRLPMPSRIDLSGLRTVLVASFQAPDNYLLDTNREIVRFLRREFSKGTDLEILPVVPPPAIPEQTLEALLANAEFWRRLGREYESDLIVSGVLRYDREDASTFQDVDHLSSQTGQKVRSNQFVEQEQFNFDLDIFFVHGGTGKVLYQDHLQRMVVYQGTLNDPITAFHSISDTFADEILVAVSRRYRQDTRVLFKK
jgi:hypothetical protein